MTNQELINHINGLNKLIESKEPGLSGKAQLIVYRNFRALTKEYNENYEKDLNRTLDEWFDRGENNKVTVKEGVDAKEANKAMKDLLELEIDVPIQKISMDEIIGTMSYEATMAIEFMVE